MDNRKYISLEEKKKILLDILVEIDQFCKENNIRYFLTGGTLLGAIRHNGFIPWDDDIDICLFRDDYEKLVSSFKSATGNVDIINRKNQKNYRWSFAKAIDNRTVLIELNKKKYKTGVFIDIFPLDNVPGEIEDAKKYVKKAWFWKDTLTIKHLRVEKGRSFLKNAAIVFAKLLYLIPDKCLIKKVEKASTKYKDKDCKYICNFSGAWKLREITEKKNFAIAISHKFEDYEFSIPEGFHEYLSGVYKDYMTPPPKEKQITHHDSVEYWKE